MRQGCTPEGRRPAAGLRKAHWRQPQGAAARDRLARIAGIGTTFAVNWRRSKGRIAIDCTLSHKPAVAMQEADGALRSFLRRTRMNDWVARWRLTEFAWSLACALAAGLCARHWELLIDASWEVRHRWLFRSIPELAADTQLLNSAIGVGVYLLCRTLFAPLLALAFGSSLLLALAAAAERKMQHLDAPILPWDLWFLGDAASLASFSGSAWSPRLVAVPLFLLLAITLSWRLGLPMVRRRGHVGAFATGCCVCAGMWFAVIAPTTPRGLSGAIHNITWDLGANHANFGPFYPFLANLRFFALPRSGEAATTAALAIDRDLGSSVVPPADPPDVVLILSEAFTTLPVDIFGKPFQCLTPDVLARLVTPSWGGFTANVEFEILTGYPNNLFPLGAVPYQMYVKRPVRQALPQVFREHGYRTSAVHTYQRSFFSRPVAYEMLGFDVYKGLEDIPAAPTRGHYVDDQVVFDQVLHILRNGGEQRQFIHAVTMMAHLPYDWPDRYPVRADLAGRLPPALQKHAVSLNQYASMVYDHEAMLCGFLETLKRRKQRTIVLFYGDHFPSFNSFAVYRDIHVAVNGPDQPFNLSRQYAQTPLFLFDSHSGFAPLPAAVPGYNIGRVLLERTGVAARGIWSMPHKRNNVSLVSGVYVASHQSSEAVRGPDDEVPRDQAELETLRSHAYGALSLTR